MNEEALRINSSILECNRILKEELLKIQKEKAEI
jgi:hypothetical protein